MIKTFITITCIFLCTFCDGKDKAVHQVDAEVRCHLSFPQSAVSNLNTIYIPFTLIGHLIVVQAKVDSFSGNFILDTGSERLILNQQYFKPDNRNAPVASAGNTGMVTDATEINIDTLHLDRLFINNLRAHIVDLSHIEYKKNTRIIGVLGYDVFQHFEVFIDFQNQRIVLSRVDRTGARLDTIPLYEFPHDSLKFELKKHVIILAGLVNGVNMRLMLDSGAELNLIDRKVNRKALDQFSIIKRVNLMGVGKKQVEVLAGTLDGLIVGHEKCGTMNTLLTRMDEMNEHFGTSLNGVLGYEYLSSRRVLINYKKRMLYFFDPMRS